MKLTKIVCCICKKICCWKLNMDIHRVVLGRSNEPHFFFKFWNVPECKVEMITRPTPALTTSDRLWLRQCQVSTHQTVSCHSVKITLFKNQKEKWSTIGWNLNSWSMKRTLNHQLLPSIQWCHEHSFICVKEVYRKSRNVTVRNKLISDILCHQMSLLLHLCHQLSLLLTFLTVILYNNLWCYYFK